MWSGPVPRQRYFGGGASLTQGDDCVAMMPGGQYCAEHDACVRRVCCPLAGLHPGIRQVCGGWPPATVGLATGCGEESERDEVTGPQFGPSEHIPPPVGRHGRGSPVGTQEPARDGDHGHGVASDAHYRVQGIGYCGSLGSDWLPSPVWEPTTTLTGVVLQPSVSLM